VGDRRGKRKRKRKRDRYTKREKVGSAATFFLFMRLRPEDGKKWGNKETPLKDQQQQTSFFVPLSRTFQGGGGGKVPAKSKSD